MTERMGYWVDTVRRPTGRWTRSTSRASGGRSSRSSTRACSPRTTASRRTARAAAPALSDHELGRRGYETVVDPSVYVRFPLTSGRYAGTAALLVWTTTPWTLVSNTAVAVRPDVTYVTATDGTETLVVAEPLVEQALGEGWTVARPVHRRRDGALDLPAAVRAASSGRRASDGHFVVLADYVTTDDGTGLVHQSPAFGAEDLAVVPGVRPAGGATRSARTGTSRTSVRLVGGEFFKNADKTLVRHLDERGLLFRHLAYEHAYPHCWRCHTALLYYAQPSWYIRTTEVKDAAARRERAHQLVPRQHQVGPVRRLAAQQHRLGAVPLPLLGHAAADLAVRGRGHAPDLRRVARRARRAGRAGPLRPRPAPAVRRRRHAALHRVRCGRRAWTSMRRVPEVIDAWYDSGSMPFAQWGYPHAPGSEEQFGRAFPAQFICEAIDQTRGWFYTLMAVDTLVHGRSSYENVLCLGHILAEDGRKMSKHLGNILQPMPLMEQHGADALRWFMAASRVAVAAAPGRAQHPAGDRPQDAADLLEHRVVPHAVRRRQRLVAAGAGRPRGGRPAAAGPVAALRDPPAGPGGHGGATRTSTPSGPGACSPTTSTDCPTGTSARSRRRFWEGDPSALATLHECLHVVTLLLAPVVPFVTERVWQDVVRPVSPEAPDSVHLAAWPKVDGALVDDGAGRRRWRWSAGSSSSGGRPAAARRCATGSRWAGRWSGRAGWAELPDELRQQVADELNVHGFDELAGELVDRSAKGNFRALGKRFGKRTPTVAAAIAAADAGELAAALRASGRGDRRGRRRGRRGRRRRGAAHRDAARGLGGGHRGRRDGGPGPRPSPPSCAAPGSPARWSGWCRRRASPPGCEVTDRVALRWQARRRAGRGAAGARRRWSRPRCWPPAFAEGGPRNRARAHRRGPRIWLHRHPFGSVIR